MNKNYLNFLRKKQPSQKQSIQSYKIGDKTVWLKKASIRHSTWIYLPLTLCAKLLDLSMLRPVPNYGGAKAIACEITRIKQLSSINIRVPTILAHSTLGILLEDISINNKPVYQLHTALLNEPSIDACLCLYQKVIKKIQDIHNLNCYLSEAFSRNILVDEHHNISFIDFETDPSEVLTLKECYIRDWLCFLFSTADCFEEHHLPTVSELFKFNLKNNKEIYNSICKVSRKINWILHFKLEKLGNDGQRLKKCLLLLSLLREKSS